MSFSRFGVDGSEVYTFPNVAGSYECCGCILNPDAWFMSPSLAAFLKHLDQHEAAGHTVPPYTRGAAQAWADENPDGWAPCRASRVIVTRRTPRPLEGSPAAFGVFGVETTDNVTATVRCGRVKGHDGHHKATPHAPGFIHDAKEVWW